MKIFLIYFGLFVTFFIKGVLLLDPDFGWHLRVGQIILSSGIPPTDPFSYAMPSFPFIDHEWLTDTSLYLIYPYGGVVTLSIIFSLLAITTLWLVFEKLEKPASLAVAVLVSSIFLNLFGVRVQVLSWVFVAILLKILLQEKIWDRFKKFLPLMLIFWVNLHGGFAIGIALLWLFGLVRFFQKKLTKSDAIVILLSTAATFVNPYGARIWEEVFRVILDPNLVSTIAEWGPGVTFVDIPFWALFLISSLLIIYDLKPRIKHISVEEWLNLIIFLVLLFAALSTFRNIPFWAIFAGQLTPVNLERFRQKFSKDKFAMKTLPKIINFSTKLILVIFVLEIGVNFYTSWRYSQDQFYPKKAIQFLKMNPPTGQIFSLYGWGGYLDWQLPEKKVFIDGRMPSMKWSGPRGESNWAFGEYGDIIRGKNQDQSFQKYNIDTILWPNYQKPNFLVDTNLEDPSLTFTTRLQQEGWRIVYQDKNSIVLQNGSL